MESPRWTIITPSQYEWERRGLDFIKAGLPDHDPYLAWANFEFQTSDGAIYEVDLLVLTKMGFWLVESKAWEGRIWGDSGTWTRSHDGKVHSEDNPVLLANRKASAPGPSRPHCSLSPDVDFGEVARPGRSRSAVPRSVGACGHGRTERDAGS